jgi:hypothetical protein
MPEESERIKARLDRIETHLGLRPQCFEAKAPFYGHTPASGMHRLKDAWNQHKYLVAQCQWLTSELDLAISATRLQAPDRPANGHGFKLADRICKPRPKNGDERQLEWDLYNEWGLGSKLSAGECDTSQDRGEAKNVCFKKLVGVQVPVYDNNLRDGWDKIDLVGINDQGEPVIVELKTGDASDKPLRVILEGVAYAIALQKVWSGFYSELEPLIRDCGVKLKQSPEKFHVCVLAPDKYWKSWKSYLHNNEHRDSLAGLVDSLKKNGFIVEYLSILENHELTPVAFP